MKLKIAMAAALLAGACSPRLYPPETAVPDRYVYSEGFSQDTTGIGSRWWEMFGDPTLDTLVARALERNRDLAAAAARVEQARANLGVVRAQYLPQIGFGVQAGGKYAEATGIVQSYAVEPTLSWEVSLFGGAAARQRSRQGRNRRLGVGARRNAALAGGRSGDDLLHAARIRAQPLDRPAYPPTAARVGGTDRLHVPLRHVGRRGTRAGPQSGPHGRSGHPAIPAGRRTDGPLARHAARRAPGAGHASGRRAAPAHRHLPRGDSRGTALGAAAQTTRHPGSALRRGESRGTGRTGPERAVSVDLADGRRRCGVGFDQRADLRRSVGLERRRGARRTARRLRKTPARRTSGRGGLRRSGEELRADRADGASPTSKRP